MHRNHSPLGMNVVGTVVSAPSSLPPLIFSSSGLLVVQCSWILLLLFTFPLHCNAPSVTAQPASERSNRPISETTSSATNSFHSLFRMICPVRPFLLSLGPINRRPVFRKDERTDIQLDTDKMRWKAFLHEDHRKFVVLLISDAVDRWWPTFIPFIQFQFTSNEFMAHNLYSEKKTMTPHPHHNGRTNTYILLVFIPTYKYSSPPDGDPFSGFSQGMS